MGAMRRFLDCWRTGSRSSRWKASKFLGLAMRFWTIGHGTRTSEELVAESYRGIRPAFGYPACPDHSEKGKLFELLGAGSAGG